MSLEVASSSGLNVGCGIGSCKPFVLRDTNPVIEMFASIGCTKLF